mgnify:CR=1 FL=1
MGLSGKLYGRWEHPNRFKRGGRGRFIPGANRPYRRFSGKPGYRDAGSGDCPSGPLSGKEDRLLFVTGVPGWKGCPVREPSPRAWTSRFISSTTPMQVHLRSFGTIAVTSKRRIWCISCRRGDAAADGLSMENFFLANRALPGSLDTAASNLTARLAPVATADA